VTLARLEAAFAARRRHLAPFVMLGDPTPELSVRLARRAVADGATMLELGIPFSAPCADGPAIQAASARALAAGTTVATALAALEAIARAAPGVPLNLLVYGNLVHARGEAAFCRRAAAAGAWSLLVPDVPLEEADALAAACADAGLGHATLVGPATDPERLARLDASATAFLYLVAHQGVTGARGTLAGEAVTRVQQVAAAARRPVCVGFGLSRPEHVRAVLGAGARLAVVGSHLARVVEGALDSPSALPETYSAALAPLLEAARDPQELPSCS